MSKSRMKGRAVGKIWPPSDGNRRSDDAETAALIALAETLPSSQRKRILHRLESKERELRRHMDTLAEQLRVIDGERDKLRQQYAEKFDTIYHAVHDPED